MRSYFIPDPTAREDYEFNNHRLIRIHPIWYSFLKSCESLKYGYIEKLKIQDGLPMIAEEAEKKIKFIGDK